MGKRKISLLSLLLALLMLGGCFVAIPTAAVSLNEDVETLDDILWELEFDKMADVLDNLGSTEYTLSKGNSTDLYEMDGQKCLGIKEADGTYYIEDTNNVLKEYEAYYIEADMYFESYPSGEAGGHTPRTYPMSFMTWITSSETGSPQYGSIRIDDEGYLCTKPAAGTRLSDSAKLPLNEWFNIRFVVSPIHKRCEVFVNHESVGSYALQMAKLDTIAKSRVRFFDTRYQYSVYFKDISVTSDSDYRIGLTKETSADYLGYQTSKITNGTFDVRFLSTMSSTDYNKTGYTIYRLTDNGQNVLTFEDVIASKQVYESVNQTALDGSAMTSKASDFGAKYLSAITAKDFSADQNVYIVVRPWVMLNGVKTYGTPQKLLYSGVVKDGYPVLAVADFATQYELSASDDTYVGGKYQKSSDTSIHGSETILDVKNSANNYSSNYTRQTYVKFTIPDKAVDLIGSAYRIVFEVYGREAAVTPAESALGGIVAKVSAVNTNWTEDDLTKNNAAENAAVIAEMGEMNYLAKSWSGIDVTEYVKEYFLDGEVAFRIENVLDDGSRECAFYSKEAEDGVYAPRLVIYPSNLNLNYEVDLGKIENVGHEPWGRAEQLVEEWFETDYDKLFMDTYDSLGLSKIDNNTANGEYSVYNPLSGSTKNAYVRTLDTLEDYQIDEKTQYDEYGGITNMGIKGRATGYFHTEKINGKTYIINPNGNPYYALGVNTLTDGATENQREAALDKYGSVEGFYEGVATEMIRDFGLNTAFGVNETGSRVLSKNGISYVVGLSGISSYMSSLGLSISTGGSSEFLYNNTMNVFDPDFPIYVDEKIGEKASLYANDPCLLGYTCDNEIPGTADYLERYLTLDYNEPVNAFSYATAWTWFRYKTEEVNPSLEDVTPEMNQEFLAFVYNTYFKTISSTIDKYDSNHMYIGNRSNTPKQEGYLRAAGQYLDLFTVNLYGRQNYININETIELMHKYTGLPFIVTEFGVRALESVDMNGYALGNYHDTACWLVQTQQQRANSYESYVLNLLESNNCVGWILYRFRDNDQTLYGDAEGNVYLLSSDRDADVATYTNAVTGEKVSGAQVELTKIYKGETDTTNLCHNKGIYDNKMEPYEEMMVSMKKISDNLISLIDYFAK
jgi:hypothetical protein